MPGPTFIYKILPSSTPPPTPLPPALPVSALDSKDQFIHCSTSQQLLGTLNLFFSSEASVYILRMPYAKLKAQGVVRWEGSGGRVGKEAEEGCFPHLYNGLRVGDGEVDEVGDWKKGKGKWSAEGWPFGGVDVPV